MMSDMSDNWFSSKNQVSRDPCALFIKGLPHTVKPSEVSDYFHDKGYPNRITYQRTHPQYFRMFMALRFENKESAQDVFHKYSNSIIFGYKIFLSFFQKHLGRPSGNNFFMQDKLRKLRAQATWRPFRSRLHGSHSPVHNFKSKSGRQSRSSSSDSDRSLSPERKRKTRSREESDSKRTRHHSRSHSHSRSSRSNSRSRTPMRFSPTSSKISSSSSDGSSDQVQQISSKIVAVKNSSEKRGKERSRGLSPLSKETKTPPSVSKEEFMRNFSPVSIGSDDDAILMMTPTPDRTNGKSAESSISNLKDLSSEQSIGSYFSLPKSGLTPESWNNSEGDLTPDGGVPFVRVSGLSPRGTRQCHVVNGKVGSFTEIKPMDRPWLLKPLTTQEGGSSSINKHSDMAYSSINIIKSPTQSSSGSPGSYRVQSPPSSFGGSPPKTNGVQKRGRASSLDLSKTKLERLYAKKEEIIKAYKQDCDTFATVVRMLIRKDPDLEQRLQHALRENLTEIGQRCVQELQDTVEQMKD